jgi:hypothetical protein
MHGIAMRAKGTKRMPQTDRTRAIQMLRAASCSILICLPHVPGFWCDDRRRWTLLLFSAAAAAAAALALDGRAVIILSFSLCLSLALALLIPLTPGQTNKQ